MNHIQVQKEKENFTSSIKRETRYFHVVVVKEQQRNVQESVMHVQSCCFAYPVLFFLVWSTVHMCPSVENSHRKRLFLKTLPSGDF